MLYLSKQTQLEFEKLTQKAARSNEIGAAEALTKLVPDFAPGYLILSARLNERGRVQEAERCAWEALRLAPFEAHPYFALAQLRLAAAPGDPMARALRALGFWKLALLDDVPDDAASLFEDLLGDEAYEPESYEVLALKEIREMEGVIEPPETAARLKPYRTLDEFQHQAASGVKQETLREILDHPAEYEPLLRQGLRHWARTNESPDDRTLQLMTAVLGEISPADAVDELLELANTGDHDLMIHVNWAIHRLGMRFPEAVLAIFRNAAGSAKLGIRCAIGDQISLMEEVKGDAEALASLVDKFELVAKEGDAAYLLAVVIHGLIERDKIVMAKTLAAKYERLVPKKDRALIQEALDPDGQFVSVLTDMEVDGPDIEGVCIDRYLMGEEEEDSEYEDEDEEDGLLAEELEDDYFEEPSRPKPGRNDPCWCGSGKKYKKCHLNADEEAERLSPSEQAEDDSLPKSLHSQMLQEVFAAASTYLKKSDMKRSMETYFGEPGADFEPTQDDFNLFVGWLLHDFRDPATKRTPIENFLRGNGLRLSKRERELLESLRDARYGLFEVESVQPGSGIQVRDLATGESRFVNDVNSSNSMTRWDALLVRLQLDEGKWIMAGDGTHVPRHILPDLREFIERESAAEGQSQAEFIRANSHRMHRIVKDLLAERLRGLKIVNREGEEVEFGVAEYEVRDEAALLAKLRSLEELVAVSGDDSEGHAFDWIQPMGEERRPMGHVSVAGGRLRLEAPSRTRLAAGRGLLESHAGDLLTHKGDSSTTVDEIKELALKRTGTRPPERKSPVPPELERELIGRVKAKHYAEWPDTPLPALNGKTARQAVRSREGRKAVVELLRTMENDEQHGASERKPAYDFNILRRDLGIEEE